MLIELSLLGHRFNHSLIQLCIDIYCPPLFDPDNGRVVFSTTATTNGVDYGSTATFSCNNEYGLTSKVVLICGGDGTSQNGTWSSDPPSCQGLVD